MKRLLILILIVLAVAVTGCSAVSPTEAPTQTPYPTYTPQPTYTPFPTATATFLPSPTPSPEPSATPTADGTSEGTRAAPTTSSAGGQGVQATLAFGSNLREGPGVVFDAITSLDAGDTLTILGRDTSGLWVYIRTSTGQEGWLAVRQLQGPVDIPRIPLAAVIPTPSVTLTPTSATTSATATTAPASGDISMTVKAGANPVCQTVTWTFANRYAVDSTTAEILPFDSTSPQNVAGRDAFKMMRDAVPDFIDVKIEGNLTPGDCRESDGTCQSATFKLCAGSPASAPTGGSEYRQNIILQIGNQSYNNFYLDVQASIPTLFIVSEP